MDMTRIKEKRKEKGEEKSKGPKKQKQKVRVWKISTSSSPRDATYEGAHNETLTTVDSFRCLLSWPP